MIVLDGTVHAVGSREATVQYRYSYRVLRTSGKMLACFLLMLPLQVTAEGDGCGRGTIYDKESASCVPKCGTGTVRGN